MFIQIFYRSISNFDRQSAQDLFQPNSHFWANKDFALVPIQYFPITETQFLDRQHIRAEYMPLFLERIRKKESLLSQKWELGWNKP